MSKSDLWKYFIALMIGIISMMLYLTLYHLYLDHLFIDLLRAQIQQQQPKS